MLVISENEVNRKITQNLVVTLSMGFLRKKKKTKLLKACKIEELYCKCVGGFFLTIK